MNLSLKTTLALAIIVPLISGCISSQRLNTTKPLPTTPELGVNSRGNVQFKGKDFSCTTITGSGTNYKDILKDFEKAKEWDSVEKPASLEKEINSYLACGLSLKYQYDKSTDKSKVITCFKNPVYQYHIDYNCLTFVDYDRVINALKQAPEVMKQMYKELDAADSLK